MKKQHIIDAIIANVGAYFVCKLVIDLIAIALGK